MNDLIYKNVHVYWNDGKITNSNAFESKIKQIEKTDKEIYFWIKKFIISIKKYNYRYGVYAVIFPDFKMIATYSKKRLFVNKLLKKSVGETKHDIRVQVLETFEDIRENPFENNSFNIFKILKESICIEKSDDYIDIYGFIKCVFEIIEIN